MSALPNVTFQSHHYSRGEESIARKQQREKRAYKVGKSSAFTVSTTEKNGKALGNAMLYTTWGLSSETENFSQNE